MYKFVRHVSKTTSLDSGEMINIGNLEDEEVKIQIIDYDSSNFKELEIKSIDEYSPFSQSPTVTWVNVDGIKLDVIEKIGKHFNLHDVIVEDILNTGQQSIIEDLNDYVIIVVKMLYYEKNGNNFIAEHVSLIVGNNFVISIQEGRIDVFDNIRKKIRGNKGRIRKMGAGFLAYSILDAIVDNYFVVLQKIGEEIEFVEEELVANPRQELLRIIYSLKRELLFLRKVIWPLREVISRMQREDSPFFKEVSGIYLRDLYDNTIQAIDTVETFRDMLCSMLDIYVSSNGNKMNQIMKVLTIISTIFIPLSFITGIYGMNIYMPEKDSHWLYPVLMTVMFSTGISMVYYFKKKKWL